jgi:hypothetical protein
MGKDLEGSLLEAIYNRFVEGTEEYHRITQSG